MRQISGYDVSLSIKVDGRTLDITDTICAPALAGGNPQIDLIRVLRRIEDEQRLAPQRRLEARVDELERHVHNLRTVRGYR